MSNQKVIVKWEVQAKKVFKGRNKNADNQGFVQPQRYTSPYYGRPFLKGQVRTITDPEVAERLRQDGGLDVHQVVEHLPEVENDPLPDVDDSEKKPSPVPDVDDSDDDSPEKNRYKTDNKKGKK